MTEEPDNPDNYFYDRAEAELEAAQNADHPAAVRAHYLLAGHYLDRFYGPPEDEEPAAEAAE
ncbi:hypothetical protein ACMGDH_13690 [Sphingomonas sp. DT-207]|uniref:hypothetical protein n=1 Tax=Sphingomonas sp. DT-207 TaxID=3396167 RepID=UPI003F1E0A5C